MPLSISQTRSGCHFPSTAVKQRCGNQETESDGWQQGQRKRYRVLGVVICRRNVVVVVVAKLASRRRRRSSSSSSSGRRSSSSSSSSRSSRSISSSSSSIPSPKS